MTVIIPVGSSQAHAQELLVPPVQAQSDKDLDDWINSDARSTDVDNKITATITRSEPTVVTAGALVTMNLKVTNNSNSDINDPEIRLAWSEPTANSSEIRISMLNNVGEYPNISEPENVRDSIDSKESKTYSIAMPFPDTDPAAVEGFKGKDTDQTLTVPFPISGPGNYPMALTIGGHYNGSDTQTLAAARTVLPVIQDAAAPAEAPAEQPADQQGEEGEGQETPEDAQPKPAPGTPLTFLWPLASHTHISPGTTGDMGLYLKDESLAKELEDGGRLDMLLDTYEAALESPQGEQIQQASCLAIDPDLIQTIDAMQNSYQISENAPSVVESSGRLRDNWGQIFHRDNPTPGEGSQAAGAWLNRLRDLAGRSCTVALPFAGANLDAVGSTDQAWLSTHALSSGADTIQRILGTEPLRDIVIPNSGYLQADSLPALPATSTVTGEDGLSGLFEESQPDMNTALPVNAHVTALVSENLVRADPDYLGNNPDLLGRWDSLAPEQRALTSRIASVPAAPRFTVASGFKLRTLSFSDQLGAAFAATGSSPEFAGYTSTQSRYNLSDDSSTQRMNVALSVLNSEISSGSPALIVPPGMWTINDRNATTLMQQIEHYFATGLAAPLPLSTAVYPEPPEQDFNIPAELLAPENDPGLVSNQLQNVVRSQARDALKVTQVMSNDPNTPFTREQYTDPIFDDILRTFSDYQRRWSGSWKDGSDPTDDSRGKQRSERTQTLLDNLDGAVTLVPPGNVFTRTSSNSPLPVVASNELPLPVDAMVQYQAEDNVSIDAPDRIMIPAQGSLSLNISMNIPTNERDSRFTLWLDAPEGQELSKPVELSVKTAPGISWLGIVGLLLALLALGFGGRWWRQRRLMAEDPDTDETPIQNAQRTREELS